MKSSGAIDDGEATGKLSSHLLLDQGFRHTAFGFLTNIMYKFQWLKKALEEVQFVRFISEMFSGVEKNALSWFSNLSLVDRGYYLPVDPSIVQLDNFLGTGATSKVYHGTLPENNKSVVVKIMTNREQVKKENKNLQELKDVPTVPKIVRVLENGLILKPCAFKLEVFQLHPEIKHGIVDTLYEADSRGLVHRDIRNEHLFTITGNSVLVNDWGSAIPKGEHTGYPGL